MPYDPALLKDEDKVRRLIGDVDNDDLIFEDSEIEYYLSINNDDLYSTAADLCEAILGEFARETNYRFSTLWLDAGDVYEHYKDLMDRFREKAGQTPTELSFTSAVSDVDYPEHIWYEMHDNPPTLPDEQ